MRGAEADDQITRGEAFGGRSLSKTTRACYVRQRAPAPVRCKRHTLPGWRDPGRSPVRLAGRGRSPESCAVAVGTGSFAAERNPVRGRGGIVASTVAMVGIARAGVLRRSG